MLSSTTCVGLRYGLHASAFLGSCLPLLSARRERLAVLSPEGFNALFRQRAGSPQLRPLLLHAGTGMLTRFPLASPFGYALGPD